MRSTHNLESSQEVIKIPVRSRERRRNSVFIKKRLSNLLNAVDTDKFSRLGLTLPFFVLGDAGTFGHTRIPISNFIAPTDRIIDHRAETIRFDDFYTFWFFISEAWSEYEQDECKQYRFHGDSSFF